MFESAKFIKELLKKLPQIQAALGDDMVQDDGHINRAPYRLPELLVFEEASSKITFGKILKNSEKHLSKDIFKLMRNIV